MTNQPIKSKIPDNPIRFHGFLERPNTQDRNLKPEIFLPDDLATAHVVALQVPPSTRDEGGDDFLDLEAEQIPWVDLLLGVVLRKENVDDGPRERHTHRTKQTNGTEKKVPAVRLFG